MCPVRSVTHDADRSPILRAGEDHAIAQFVLRGAGRNPDFGGAYAIYLYSENGAERLSRHLLKIGFANVELVGLDEVGIMDATRPKPCQRVPTSEEQAAQKDKRRKKDAARTREQRAIERRRRVLQRGLPVIQVYSQSSPSGAGGYFISPDRSLLIPPTQLATVHYCQACCDGAGSS